MPGTSAPACPPISECCPERPPKEHYYATFTWQSRGCDCVSSIVVALSLYDYGDYTLNPYCPGCKTNETWLEWRGESTHADCFDGNTLRFCVRMVCDPAGVGTACENFLTYVQITCGSPAADCDFGGVGMTNLPLPDTCTCTPTLDLVWSTVFELGDAGCCRNTVGDALPGDWTLEITE